MDNLLKKANNEVEKVMGMKEIATELGLSYWTIWKWQREGKIPTIKLGKKLFFRVSSVVSRLAELEEESMVGRKMENAIGTLRRID